MQFFHSGGCCLILARVIVITVKTFPAAAAAAASFADWQLAASSNENALDFNAPSNDGWTLATNLFAEGSDAVAFNSETIDQSTPFGSISDSDDNQQLFMDDGYNPQTELLLADTVAKDGGEECSASDNLAGKTRRRRQIGRRNSMCSSSVGIVTGGGPTLTMRDASTFDLLYCLGASIFIKSLFVCSSPDPTKTVISLGISTLYESTRGKQTPPPSPPFPFLLHSFSSPPSFLPSHTQSVSRQISHFPKKTPPPPRNFLPAPQ